jgi:hypothetical protein
MVSTSVFSVYLRYLFLGSLPLFLVSRFSQYSSFPACSDTTTVVTRPDTACQSYGLLTTDYLIDKVIFFAAAYEVTKKPRLLFHQTFSFSLSEFSIRLVLLQTVDVNPDFDSVVGLIHVPFSGPSQMYRVLASRLRAKTHSSVKHPRSDDDRFIQPSR